MLWCVYRTFDMRITFGAAHFICQHQLMLIRLLRVCGIGMKTESHTHYMYLNETSVGCWFILRVQSDMLCGGKIVEMLYTQEQPDATPETFIFECKLNT